MGAKPWGVKRPKPARSLPTHGKGKPQARDCPATRMWQRAHPMPRPWKLIESVQTPEGALELRQRDTSDFMISIAGRVLMSSIIHRSESMIAELGCERAKGLSAPSVLIGGLGLGFTLRAALDALPRHARVCVAELNPVVVTWGRGPLRALTGAALEDSRVEVVVGDVATVVRAAAQGRREKFDAIIVDLYLGPSQGADAEGDPLYGRNILKATKQALKPRGSYTVWGEEPDPSFERRLAEAGFKPEVVRNRGGGPRHVIYMGRT
jgi:spermidine synthase